MLFWIKPRLLCKHFNARLDTILAQHSTFDMYHMFRMGRDSKNFFYLNVRGIMNGLLHAWKYVGWTSGQQFFWSGHQILYTILDLFWKNSKRFKFQSNFSHQVLFEVHTDQTFLSSPLYWSCRRPLRLSGSTWIVIH